MVAATEGFLAARSIAAPLMVVRGDGALVSAAFARQRPIETILSGPAASLVGARHMTGLDNAVVSDIGGTTTDVAVLDHGRPRLDPEGATVGGFRTMVEAVAMRTFGLGGDSEVALEDGALNPKILLGPRRLVPLALAGVTHGGGGHGGARTPVARAQCRPHGRPFRGAHRRAGRLAAGLTAPEAKLYEMIGAVPLALDRLLDLERPERDLATGWCRAGWSMSSASRRRTPPMCWASRPTGTRRSPASAPNCLRASATAAASFIAASPEEMSERVLVTLTRWSAE